jgi:THUMP domain-like/RNA cap guanine-N2 methyltransferase
MTDYGICGAGPGITTVPAAVASLLAPDGQALLAELRETEVTPDSALQLGTRLRQRYPAGLVASALAQQELRWRARAKFSRAMDMYFTRDGLEQASSEPVARHRAGRLAAAATASAVAAPAGRAPVIADLCCGIGGDLIALAEAAGDGLVLAVDRDPVHLAMAAANAAVCGLAGRVRTWGGDVRDAPLAGLAAVFIDPARRDGGRRMAPGASEPPLDWCLSLAGRVPLVAVKAAPGLALEDVPGGWETEFVATGRDLKEAVLWSPALAGAATRATVLPGGEQLTPLPDGAAGAAGAAGAVRPPGEYLLDPSPAVTRAGLVRDLAVLTGGRQIDDQIAFLSADVPLVSPFGRSLRVLDSGPWNQKQLPGRLRAAGAGSVDIRRRGLAGNVEVLHRQLARQLDPAATRRITLVMTRAAGRPWALVCEDLR